jgi:hypothetical protein
MSRTAAETAKRVIFNILSPGDWLLVIQSENGFGVRHHRIAFSAANRPVCGIQAPRCRCTLRVHQIDAVGTCHWQMQMGSNMADSVNALQSAVGNCSERLANPKTRWPRGRAGPSFRQKVVGLYTKGSKKVHRN